MHWRNEHHEHFYGFFSAISTTIALGGFVALVQTLRLKASKCRSECRELHDYCVKAVWTATTVFFALESAIFFMAFASYRSLAASGNQTQAVYYIQYCVDFQHIGPRFHEYKYYCVELRLHSLREEVITMHLIKDIEHIPTASRTQALSVMNKLKAGNRVFGNPAEGLKITLKNLEKQIASAEASRGKLDYLPGSSDLSEQVKLLKAGINGEEKLAEYLELVVKYDPGLEDIVFFASMSDPSQNSGGNDYISDSDFVALYGDHVLILDAKNIRTNPELPIYLDGNMLVTVGGKEIMELHPSTYVWQRVFQNVGLQVESIHGCVVVVNESGATVWKNKDWHHSEVKPMHISDLVKYLHEWIQGKEPNVRLSVLTALANMQIRQEKGTIDFSDARRRFGI